jgi:hypothetical protein
MLRIGLSASALQGCSRVRRVVGARKKSANLPLLNSTENLAATVSFRLTDEECRVLALRADSEQRTVSLLVRLLLRDVLASAA